MTNQRLQLTVLLRWVDVAATSIMVYLVIWYALSESIILLFLRWSSKSSIESLEGTPWEKIYIFCWSFAHVDVCRVQTVGQWLNSHGHIVSMWCCRILALRLSWRLCHARILPFTGHGWNTKQKYWNIIFQHVVDILLVLFCVATVSVPIPKDADAARSFNACWPYVSATQESDVAF